MKTALRKTTRWPIPLRRITHVVSHAARSLAGSGRTFSRCEKHVHLFTCYFYCGHKLFLKGYTKMYLLSRYSLKQTIYKWFAFVYCIWKVNRSFQLYIFSSYTLPGRIYLQDRRSSLHLEMLIVYFCLLLMSKL